jgi:hypothetical protein
MLDLGYQRQADCQRVSRRALLQVGSLGALGVSLADLLRLNTSRAAESTPPAKSVILLWLWGGPSHLDTFDLKPKAPVEYRGPYAPIDTSAPGVQICELLPRLAERADKYAIIRSLHHNSNDHGIGGTIGLTGSQTGGASLGGPILPGRLQPTHGSIVSRVLGPGEKLPRFVAIGGHLHQGKKPITGEGASYLGPMYDPFRLDYDPDEGVKLPQLKLHDGVSAGGLGSRRDLLAAIDGLTRRLDRSPGYANSNIAQLDAHYQQAFSLLTTKAAQAVFDVDGEPEKLRDRYGRFRFGQCCLLARRLVEAGVRFVQVNWSSHVEGIEDTGDGGWDTHDRNFAIFQDRYSWMLDQALSALLDDLSERGLLSETIVVAKGEFGRTPKINNKAGRDHWEKCYSALVAGGGIRGGQVIGASDRHAEHPVSRAVTPADLFGTVLRRIGIDTTKLTSVNLPPQGEAIEELM